MQLITATIDIVAVVVVVVLAPLSSTAVATTELNCATGQCQMAKSGETGSGPLAMFHCEWDVSRRESRRFHYANLQLRLQLVDCGSIWCPIGR